MILDDDVVINNGSIIEGPVYLGKNTSISSLSVIKSNTVIGPKCKIGGEVICCNILGYSNKAHEGFLGHSYVGEWVNIGAGTNNSNLKNNYSNIKIVILASPNQILKEKKMISELGLDYVIPSYTTETIIDAAAIVEQLDLIITPDTSIVHIASSFDKPVVSIPENNKDSFRLWSPSSTLSKTVFAKSNYGLFDYNVDEIIKYSLGFIRKFENK